VVFIFVPGKKQLILQVVHGSGTVCADALRRAKTSDAPAPTINFEAARKLRRDLISVALLENISVTFLLTLYECVKKSSGFLKV
jgi:hypothetical protein